MPSSIELFAGGGGMAIGLDQAGFSAEQLVEIDKRAVSVLLHNGRREHWWPEEAVRQVDVRKWLSDELTEVDAVDLVAGGPPCQPFSLGGAHAGHEDERNMFPAAVDAVRGLRPKVVIFENVPGLLRPSFLPYYDFVCDQVRHAALPIAEDPSWRNQHDELTRASEGRRADYHVFVHQLNAADFGSPQGRRRVFMVAIRSDVQGAATWQGPAATHSERVLLESMSSGDYWRNHGLPPRGLTAQKQSRLESLRRQSDDQAALKPWRTIRDAVADLPEPVEGEPSPSVSNHVGIPGARIYKGHTGSDFDWPSKTIKAGVHGVCGGEAMIRFSDGSLRYLTVRESARMQSFPDDYEFPGARSPMMWTIGNAVSVAVAQAIGSQLRQHTGI